MHILASLIISIKAAAELLEMSYQNGYNDNIFFSDEAGR